ncbi:MAG: hypothetical protein EXX96DRAFT_492588 [Benjaminiella poitrasii]|nr:MAG: hypothetical protein EXX96DRAFT_492588 [Benjaminiella poitrasii]
MNKDTFIMRTKIIEGGEAVPYEILDIMYDNIVMSEFTYADGHKESNTSPSISSSSSNTTTTTTNSSWFSKLKSTNNDSNSIQPSVTDLSQKLEQLMPAENSFSYKRTLKPIPIMDVHFSLLKAKSLCLAGVRSRHENNNSSNTFTIRVTKAGILDRKYDLIQGGKKATARSWRAFGIILSGSQIIFFADTSSFQNWMDEKKETASSQTPRRNNSFPALASSASLIPTEPSDFNSNTVTSLASLYTTQDDDSATQPIKPIPSNSLTASSNMNYSSSNSFIAHSYLRPVQIISLSYAVCIYDEEYTKYPHVFRLITGDGQQFLFRSEDDQEMEDWMLKINYAATLKTTGVRMRPTTFASLSSSSSSIAKRSFSSNTTDRLKREEKAREKVEELSNRIDEQVRLLDRELQLRRNLMVLTPCAKSTKDRILAFADAVGKRIKSKRIELQRLQCYRDYLECELAWCHSQHQYQKQQQKSRKMSLPLPSHLYSSTDTTSTDANDTANTNNTVPSTSSTSASSTLSSSASSGQHLLDNASSAVSCEGENEDGDQKVDFDDKNNQQEPTIANQDETPNGNDSSNKETMLDRIIRRRSQSNPIFPNNSKKSTSLLELSQLTATNNSSSNNNRRQRSGSEVSSVQGDDDDMSVVIVNDPEDSSFVTVNDEKDTQIDK